MAIFGGMAVQKQQRLLNLHPNIVVATPGRLWELMSEREPLFMNMNDSLRFLVLDEADRMIERGHFKDLDSILKETERKRFDERSWRWR